MFRLSPSMYFSSVPPVPLLPHHLYPFSSVRSTTYLLVCSLNKGLEQSLGAAEHGVAMVRQQLCIVIRSSNPRLFFQTRLLPPQITLHSSPTFSPPPLTPPSLSTSVALPCYLINANKASDGTGRYIYFDLDGSLWRQRGCTGFAPSGISNAIRFTPESGARHFDQRVGEAGEGIGTVHGCNVVECLLCDFTSLGS